MAVTKRKLLIVSLLFLTAISWASDQFNTQNDFKYNPTVHKDYICSVLGAYIPCLKKVYIM